MKKILDYTSKNIEKIKTLKKIYLVGCWANYGVREYAFAGKYVRQNELMIPLVYDFDNWNGTYEHFVLLPINYVTTGQIIMWTFSKQKAEKIADGLRMVYVKEQAKKGR